MLRARLDVHLVCLARQELAWVGLALAWAGLTLVWTGLVLREVDRLLRVARFALLVHGFCEDLAHFLTRDGTLDD